MASKTRRCPTVLGTLCVLLSVVIIGLAAGTVAWHEQSRNYRVKGVQRNWGNPYQVVDATFNASLVYQNIVNWMDYQPKVTLKDTYCSLAAGVAGTILGTIGLACSYSKRERSIRLHIPGDHFRERQPSKVSIFGLVDVALAILTLAVTCATWIIYATNLRTFWRHQSYALPRQAVNYTINLTNIDFHGRWTFSAWNCALMQNVFNERGKDVVSQDTVIAMCRVGGATRYMVMALMFVALIKLGLGVWARRRRKTGYSRTPEGTVAEKREEDSSESSELSVDGQKPVEAPTATVHEMPTCRTCRAEVDGVGYREMEGSYGGGEMEGDLGVRELSAEEVAVEAPCYELDQDPAPK